MKYTTDLINTESFNEFYMPGTRITRDYELRPLCINKHGNINYFSTKSAAEEIDEALGFAFTQPVFVAYAIYMAKNRGFEMRSFKTNGEYIVEVENFIDEKDLEAHPEKIHLSETNLAEFSTTGINVLKSGTLYTIVIPKPAIITSTKFADSVITQLMTVNAGLILSLLLHTTNFSLVDEYDYNFSFILEKPFDASKFTRAYTSTCIQILKNNRQFISQTREDDFVCVE